MALGDVTSNERGSGARYNDGKPDLSLIPLHIVVGSFRASGRHTLRTSVKLLGAFQITGDVGYLDSAIETMRDSWLDCARVFEYGRQKYAAWNWAKGMQWSAPLACAGRHTLKVLLQGEENDDESGLPHVGHYLANLVMLRTFVDSYPEGNDLPPPEFFRPTTAIPPTPSALLDPHFA